MAGLWDYDDVPEEPDAWKESEEEEEEIVIDEDEESAKATSRKAKRQKTSCAHGGKKRSLLPEEREPTAISLLSDDDEDEDDIGVARPAAESSFSARMRAEARASLHENSKVEPVEECLNPETRQLLEQMKISSRALTNEDIPSQFEEEPAAPPVHPHIPRYSRMQAGVDPEPASTSGPATSRGTDGATGDSVLEETHEQDVVKLKLKCQCKAGYAHIKIRPGDPFSKLAHKFAKHAFQQGWSQSVDQEMKLEFDGDLIDLDKSPEDLEIEDDYTIDVMWKVK